MDTDSDSSGSYVSGSPRLDTSVPNFNAQRVITPGCNIDVDNSGSDVSTDNPLSDNNEDNPLSDINEDNAHRNLAFPDAQPLYDDGGPCSSHTTKVTKVLSEEATRPRLRSPVVYPPRSTRSHSSPPMGRAGRDNRCPAGREVGRPAQRESEGCSSRNAGRQMSCSQCHATMRCPFCSPQPSTSRGVPSTTRVWSDSSPEHQGLSPVPRDRSPVEACNRGNDRTPRGETHTSRSEARSQGQAQAIDHPLVVHEGGQIKIRCPVLACQRVYLNVTSARRHVVEKHERLATPLKRQLEGIRHLDRTRKKCEDCGMLQELKLSITNF